MWGGGGAGGGEREPDNGEFTEQRAAICLGDIIAEVYGVRACWHMTHRDSPIGGGGASPTSEKLQHSSSRFEQPSTDK